MSNHLENLSEITARLFTIDCVEHVLPNFYRSQPDDFRPFQALQAAKAYAHNEISEEELILARDQVRRVLSQAVDLDAASLAVREHYTRPRGVTLKTETNAAFAVALAVVDATQTKTLYPTPRRAKYGPFIRALDTSVLVAGNSNCLTEGQRRSLADIGMLSPTEFLFQEERQWQGDRLQLYLDIEAEIEAEVEVEPERCHLRLVN